MFDGLQKDIYCTNKIVPNRLNQLQRIASFYGNLSHEAEITRNVMTTLLNFNSTNLDYYKKISQDILEKASTISFMVNVQ